MTDPQIPGWVHDRGDLTPDGGEPQSHADVMPGLEGPQPPYQPMETAPKDGSWINLWIMPEGAHVLASTTGCYWCNDWWDNHDGPITEPILGWSPITPTVTAAAYAQEQQMRDDVARRARVDAAKDAVVEAAIVIADELATGSVASLYMGAFYERVAAYKAALADAAVEARNAPIGGA